MQDTPKKAPTTSLTEKIASELKEVLDGPLARRSPRLAQRLVDSVLYLHKENRRLTSSNAQLERLRAEALKDLLACQLQLQLLDKRVHSDPRKLRQAFSRVAQGK